MPITPDDLSIPAVDGYPLAATIYKPAGSATVDSALIINAAMAIPRRFYRHFAGFMAEAGYGVIAYDYRGIGGSAPQDLRGFPAMVTDWVEKDMAGVIDWAEAQFRPRRICMVGHSIGGQIMGLLPNGGKVSAALMLSAQSGYWALQGGWQKAFAAFHMYVSFPVLTALLGYMPWKIISAGENLPPQVARQWSGWCRSPRYILGDRSLPLERYQQFSAPVLAYSFDDDDWGTSRSVNTMMAAYPHVERLHIVPADYNLKAIGHIGYFREPARVLWQQSLDWLNKQAGRVS